MPERSRFSVRLVDTHYLDGYNGSTRVSHQPYTRSIVGEQKTSDTDHHWRGSSSGGDVGGAFYSSNQLYTPGNTPDIKLRYGYVGTSYKYDGPLAITGSSYFPSPAASSVLSLVGKGATAIANTTPTNPAWSAAQFIGELHEGLPSMIGSNFRRGNGVAASGDEYLNLQFGVKPLANDVRGFAKTVKDTHKILRQYERDSGRLVRRRFTFPTYHSTERWDRGLATPWPTFPAPAWTGGFQFPLVETLTTQVDTWFSGAYVYYLNLGSSAWDQMQRHEQEANRLLGTRITPSTAYELTPWSWAADWVSNLGDVAQNISSFGADGLVLHHGYIMERSTVSRTFEMKGVALQGQPKYDLSQTYTTVVKQRVKATPYGFGLKTDGFNPRQVAILAALGLSRSR